jgi:hypothetical protein
MTWCTWVVVLIWFVLYMIVVTTIDISDSGESNL